MIYLSQRCWSKSMKGESDIAKFVLGGSVVWIKMSGNCRMA